MIVRLHGTLLERGLDEIVLDCDGVGYGIACSLGTVAKLPAEGQKVGLRIYTHVAEDALRLYGFYDADERGCFVALLATAGVGPKLALTILSTLSPGELRAAVARRDRTMLTRIPGVGGKKAERLLLELQDRLKGPVELPVANRTVHQDDLRSALQNLGFAAQQAEHTAAAIGREAAPDAKLPDLVRLALQRLTKRS